MAKTEYHFNAMSVGDSMFVSADEVGGNLNRVRVAAAMYHKRTGHRFVCRSNADRSGITVWRVS